MSGTGHEGPSVIEQLAAYVTGEALDRLPAATVVAARRAILDTLGVTLAGAVEPTAERVRTMIEHRRAGPEATIVGTSLRAAVEDAALANGTASHALDYDDVQASLSGHPSAPILSAALALAEQRRASGADLLTAFVIGVEIEAKLGRAVNPAHYEVGWHATSTLGTIGAAAAAAKLRGLSTERTAAALAIAATMRLRLALRVAMLISKRDSKQIAQSWFMGLNPQLNDRSPARLLREGDIDDVGPEIISAARAFVVGG